MSDAAPPNPRGREGGDVQSHRVHGGPGRSSTSASRGRLTGAQPNPDRTGPHLGRLPYSCKPSSRFVKSVVAAHRLLFTSQGWFATMQSNPPDGLVESWAVGRILILAQRVKEQ